MCGNGRERGGEGLTLHLKELVNIELVYGDDPQAKLSPLQVMGVYG